MINRIPPNLPAHAVKTYAMTRPTATHFREGTCAEANCQAWANGWRTTVDTGTELGRRQELYIRTQSGRAFTAERVGDALIAFTFPEGQACFRSPHQIAVEREPIWLVHDGDWRGNPRGTAPRVHASADDWVDDFANHQDRLAREQG